MHAISRSKAFTSQVKTTKIANQNSSIDRSIRKIKFIQFLTNTYKFATADWPLSAPRVRALWREPTSTLRLALGKLAVIVGEQWSQNSDVVEYDTTTTTTSTTTGSMKDSLFESVANADVRNCWQAGGELSMTTKCDFSLIFFCVCVCNQRRNCRIAIEIHLRSQKNICNLRLSFRLCASQFTKNCFLCLKSWMPICRGDINTRMSSWRKRQTTN